MAHYADNFCDYFDVLRNHISEILKTDLTIGRMNEGYLPYNEMELFHVIYVNRPKIDEAMLEIVVDYYEAGKLHWLYNPDYDSIREYMYEYIDISINEMK